MDDAEFNKRWEEERDKRRTVYQKAKLYLDGKRPGDPKELLQSLVEEIEENQKEFSHIARNLAKEFEQMYAGYFREAKKEFLGQLAYYRYADAKEVMTARMGYCLKELVEYGRSYNE